LSQQPKNTDGGVPSNYAQTNGWEEGGGLKDIFVSKTGTTLANGGRTAYLLAGN